MILIEISIFDWEQQHKKKNDDYFDDVCVCLIREFMVLIFSHNFYDSHFV